MSQSILKELRHQFHGFNWVSSHNRKDIGNNDQIYRGYKGKIGLQLSISGKTYSLSFWRGETRLFVTQKYSLAEAIADFKQNIEVSLRQ